MSSSHPIWSVPATDSTARIGLTPCPGTQTASLGDALTELRQWGATAIITLMTTAEMEDCQVASLGTEVEKHGLLWFHLPVDDEHGPDAKFQDLWKEAAPKVHQLLDEGHSIAIHCKGGSGRTGLIAAQIMLEQGMGLQETLDLIKAQRPNAFSVPAQHEYINEVARRS